MSQARLRLFDAAALRPTLANAAASPRKRPSLNVHKTLEDPIQRMLNVFQPGTYLRPHRHEPHRLELFLVLTGRAGLLTFGDAGAVAETAILEPDAVWAVELPGFVWHTVVSLGDDTALFEVKPGPTRPSPKRTSRTGPRPRTVPRHRRCSRFGSAASRGFPPLGGVRRRASSLRQARTSRPVAFGHALLLVELVLPRPHEPGKETPRVEVRVGEQRSDEGNVYRH